MSSVFMTRKGAGAAVMGAFAVIGVSYPAGSSCTLGLGGRVYRDYRRDGTAFFAVPAAGDWTAAITDGERTSSRTVPITERGQLVRVLLLYTADALFEPGSGTESLWKTTDYASASSESIVLQASARIGQSLAYLKEPVSMAGKSTLTVSARQTVNPVSSSQGELKPSQIYIIPEDTTAFSVTHAVKSLSIGAGDFTGENACRIDISDLDAGKRYYVTLRARIVSGGSGDVPQDFACALTVIGVSLS